MKTLLLCLLFVNFCFGNAHEPVWHEGSVVLTDNTVLTGEIAIDAVHHFVLHRNHGLADFYPAFQVSEIFFYDATQHLNRKFHSISGTDGTMRMTLLYEVVVPGPLAVLRLRKQGAMLSDVPDRDNFNYMIRYGNSLLPLRQFRTRVYAKVRKQIPSLTKYMHDNRLSLYSDADLITIIQYINRSRSAGPVAVYR